MRRVDGLLLECTRCRQMRPRGQFHKRVGGGWRSHCKDCAKPARAAVASRRRKRVVGSYRAEDVHKIYAKQGGLCTRCNRFLAWTGYHVDHVVPIAKGGLNVAANLQLLCPRCNLRKGAK